MGSLSRRQLAVATCAGAAAALRGQLAELLVGEVASLFLPRAPAFLLNPQANDVFQ